MSVLFSRSEGSALSGKMSSVSHWGHPGEVLPSLQCGGSWHIICLRPEAGLSSSLILVRAVPFLTCQVLRAGLHPVIVRKDTEDHFTRAFGLPDFFCFWL